MPIESGEIRSIDNYDAYGDMVSRRDINETYAEKPLDLNEAGLKMAAKHTSLGTEDAILDLGCSSGFFALKAAEATDTKAHVIGLDPVAEDFNFMPADADTSRFSFMQGFGENIPLPDNAVKAVTAHNVLFRVSDLPKVLSEITRVTEPGGLLIASTNALYHAFWRHTFERVIANAMAHDGVGHVVAAPPPAQGCYLEDLPTILENSGDLQVIDKLTHFSAAIITRDRIAGYLLPIQFSANRSSVPPELRGVWRQYVRNIVEAAVSDRIDTHESEIRRRRLNVEPRFEDIIHRGLVVARNLKR